MSPKDQTPAGENGRSVLRLYAWEPPCLSLGYAQPIGDVDRKALQDRGWGIVRRPTSGRAILHTDELTYAVIGPHSEPRLAGGVLESYQRLSTALLDALHRLDVPAESQAKDRLHKRGGSKGPVCFEVPSHYEITLNGKKLIGSAQSRRRAGVLQHGSLPLFGDLQRITEALAFPDEAARSQAAERLSLRATTVTEGLGKPVTFDEAAQVLCEAFENVLDIELIPDQLTTDELRRAEELVANKYGNEDWTSRV